MTVGKKCDVFSYILVHTLYAAGCRKLVEEAEFLALTSPNVALVSSLRLEAESNGQTLFWDLCMLARFCAR